MEVKKVHAVYFSPTGTTQSVVRIAAASFSREISEHNTTAFASGDVQSEFEADDFVIFGFPVYGGRVPRTFRDRLNGIKGRRTPAALIATYGNREYGDALFEMKDLAQDNGFLPVGAAAVVTEHSVIRSIATGRPDSNDIAFIEEFCSELKKKLASLSGTEKVPELIVPGRKPYRRYISLPMAPVVSASCTACGLCERACPAGAISKQDPRKTDKNMCIGCMRCVRLCPQKARKLSKWKMVAGQIFLSGAAQTRKEPEKFL